MIGYRKFSIAAIYIVSCIVLLVTGHLPGAGWMDAMSTALVAFFGSNLMEYVAKIVKEKING